MFSDLTYWTSGSNEGLTEPSETEYAWCPEKKLIDQELIEIVKESKSPEIERCLAFKRDKNEPSLIHADCNQNHLFICEV
jgi:hypothetical protein